MATPRQRPAYWSISPHYSRTRRLASLVVAAAAEVLARHLLDGSRRNFECTLRDLRLSRT
ncbi:MAG TPA: hypothetical protein VKE41_16155 [Roseiflexaceae bacterium]|nr:hypothetical protein [Roseiflexaceae bacterium]